MGNWKRLVLLLFAIASTIAGQQSSSTVRGILTDASGAVIPAAKVVLISAETRRDAETQVDGSFAFTGLASGEYTAKVEFPGFEPFQKAITLETGRNLQLPIQLIPSGGKQEVTVSGGQGPELSVDAASNASALVVNGEDLDALPDDPDDLSDVLTQLAGPASAATGGPTILLDGFSGGQLPPKAAIKEIKLNQNPFSAEFDNLGFGRIEIVTKPGADSLRGGVGMTDSDAYFNSRNPYAANKADYVNRMFSGNLGGALSHKASFLLNFTRNIINNTALIDAVTLDPSNLNAVPVRATVVTPRTDLNGSGRFDYQISTNHTFTSSYQYYKSDRDNNGIGGYSLTSREYSNEYTRHDLRLTETAVLGPSAVSETKFAYSRGLTSQFGDNSTPAIVVSGSFNGGSAQVGPASNQWQQYEIQSNTTVVHKAHSLRFGVRMRETRLQDVSPANFGGTFTFFGVSNAPVLTADNQMELGSDGKPLTENISSLEQYRRTLLFQKLGYPTALIQSLGGGASQFTVTGGNPLALVNVFDASPYVQDEWRLRPDFSLSAGLRFETQTHISDHADWAPRVALAWSPGAGNGGAPPKTVIRAGIGMFYNRYPNGLIIQATHLNGINQQQFIVSNPTFFPQVPSLSTLQAEQQPPRTYSLENNSRTIAIRQAAFTLERQLPGKTTLSATWQNLLATHLFTSVNVNAPLPGTYIPGQPTSGVRPLGSAAGNPFVYEGNAYLREKIGWVTLTNKINSRVSVTAYYTFMWSDSDIDDIGPPSNPYNIKQDISRSGWDRRNYFTLEGSFKAPLKIQLSPFFIMASGQPYNLTIGSDLNGDTIANDRPAFATDFSRPSVVFTKFGAFDTSPIPGQTRVPRNYLVGTPMRSLNLRVGRTFTFGKPRTKDSKDGRYTLNFNVDGNNVFNHVNQGNWVGNLSSPLFGQSTGLYLTRDTSNNRRIQLGTQFNF
jgi:hypothetical protein